MRSKFVNNFLKRKKKVDSLKNYTNDCNEIDLKKIKTLVYLNIYNTAWPKKLQYTQKLKSTHLQNYNL